MEILQIVKSINLSNLFIYSIKRNQIEVGKIKLVDISED